jgi:hypothetical protein
MATSSELTPVADRCDNGCRNQWPHAFDGGVQVLCMPHLNDSADKVSRKPNLRNNESCHSTSHCQ